jgi:hypothetical protein
MKKERDSQQGDLTGRIKSLDQFTGTLVARPQSEEEAVPIAEVPAGRVSQPRRSRIFLRNGEGHGVFADLTITAPLPRAAIE